jgi:hypothetical protein
MLERARFRILRARPAINAALLAAMISSLAGCADEPVQWGDISYRKTQLGDPVAMSARRDADLPAIAGSAAPCRNEVVASPSGTEVFRAWWSTRADSNAVLSLQRSADSGRTWLAAVTVDDRDAGRRGCDRPAPGIAYDSVSRYVYLTYYLDARDGSGVFFAHSMDNGKMFHSPVPVVYGNRPSAAAVAGKGDDVVVIFEDPNATTPTLGYVLSHTTGHIFEERGQVTPEEVRAAQPWVKLAGNRIEVCWLSADATDHVGCRQGITNWR